VKQQYRLAVSAIIMLALSGCAPSAPALNPTPVAPTTSPAGTGQLSPTTGSVSAPVPSGSAQPSSVAPDCPAGIALPAGVDPDWVCAPTPPSMKVLPSFPDPIAESGAAAEWNGFTTPDRTVTCSWFEGGVVTCLAKDMTVPLPADPRVDRPEQVSNCERGLGIADGVAGKTCNGGVMELDGMMDDPRVPVLEYGFSVRSLDYPYPWDPVDQPKGIVACITEVDGVTCWDADTTHHGFKIGQHIAVFW